MSRGLPVKVAVAAEPTWSLIDQVCHLLLYETLQWTSYNELVSAEGEPERWLQVFRHARADITLAHSEYDKRYPFLVRPLRYQLSWIEKRQVRKTLVQFAQKRIALR